MREQSSSNISNTHKVFRGGETKVMKKSLVSLLVFALVFTMVAPAFAAAETGLSDIGNSYAKEEIEALVEAGIIGGYPDGTFKPRNAITRAEFAKILALAADLEEDAAAASVFTDVPAWAAGYVGALVNAEITKGKSETRFGSNDSISRQELAVFFVRAWGLEEAAEESTLEVDFEDASSVAAWAKSHVALAGAIEFIKGLPNGNFDPTGNAERQAVARLAYEFYVNGDEYKEAAEKVLGENQPVPEKLEVSSVSADNLKEVEVEFNQELDELTATTKELYTVKRDIAGASSLEINTAVLLEDGKTVRIELVSALENNGDYLLDVAGVKSAQSNSVTEKGIKFKAVDRAIPEVDAVRALGKKTIKVTFSEPVAASASVSASSYFQVDGKNVSGVLEVEGRDVFVNLFTELSVGDHELTVHSIRDFADYQIISTTVDFEVVEDNDPPTIVEAKNVTHEKVTVVFSEDVVDSTVSHNNVLWKEGTIERKASAKKRINSTTYEFTFSGGNRLPSYETALYVTGVEDYSGNRIAADTHVMVNAVLDTNRPEVIVFAADADQVRLKFNKTIDHNSFNTDNVVIKDKDGKEVSNVYYGPSENTSDVVIEFAHALRAGEYEITVTGLRDTTVLANTMSPYTNTISIGDTGRPSVVSVVSNNPVYIITFDKTMDISSEASVLSERNYHAEYTVDNNSNPVQGALPQRTTLEITPNQKTVIVTVPNGVELTKLTVQGVKSAAGNFLEGYAVEVLSHDNLVENFAVEAAKATAHNRVEVKFNQPVSSVFASDFRVDGVQPTRVSINSSDNSIAVLTLPNNTVSADASETLDVVGTSSRSVARLALVTSSDVELSDAIAPEIVKNSNGKVVTTAVYDASAGINFVDGDTIRINFTEELQAPNADVAAGLFKVTRTDGRDLVYGVDYTATFVTGTSYVEIQLIPTGSRLAGYNGSLYVSFTNTGGYIKDNTSTVDFDGTALRNNAKDFNTRTDALDRTAIRVNFPSLD